MNFTRKRYFFTVRDFWFCCNREKEHECGADFIQYHDVNWRIDEDPALVYSSTGHTLISDLSEDIDSIQKKIKKNGRYEIRRAKRENYGVAIFSNHAILDQSGLLRRIADQHSHMFMQKGLKAKDEYPVMYAALKANMLTVSICHTEQGKECVYHVYLTGNDRVRLLHSISVYRDANSAEERNAIGRASRLLHFEDMVWFKEHGFLIYDWGGYSDGKLSGIDDFKASFGGRVESRSMFVLSGSLLGRFFGYIAKRWRE